jgi:hypothetical protein
MMSGSSLGSGNVMVLQNSKADYSVYKKKSLATFQSEVFLPTYMPTTYLAHLTFHLI